MREEYEEIYKEISHVQREASCLAGALFRDVNQGAMHREIHPITVLRFGEIIGYIRSADDALEQAKKAFWDMIKQGGFSDEKLFEGFKEP
jgi:Asp-tRNA(Asn)/Glu-tRNA(Gln) amidotransferase B subunit